MRIRVEQADDVDAVRAVNQAAFETPQEADLVAALRERARPLVSLVAEDRDAIVGHIMLSPVTLAGHPDLRLMGLGPMAVVPPKQRKGVGSDLVRAGLDACTALGASAVVVLGHPSFYPRFGFVPGVRLGVTSEYDVPEEAFMVIELRPGCLRGRTGTVVYHPAFGEV